MKLCSALKAIFLNFQKFMLCLIDYLSVFYILLGNGLSGHIILLPLFCGVIMSRTRGFLIMTAQRSFPSFSVQWLLSAVKALCVVWLMAFLPFIAMAADKFETLVEQARGQSVYFNAWGGSPAINAYITWAAEQLKRRHNIKLIHVKLTDTADAVSRILAERLPARQLAALLI
jgi:hypothetical protein